MIPAWMSVTVPEPGDDPAEQHDREVRRVLAHPVVAQRDQLVTRRGEPHHPVPMDRARRVDVPPRQHERELRDQPFLGRAGAGGPVAVGGGGVLVGERVRQCRPAHHSTSRRSQVTTSFSVSTEVSPALRAPISRLLGQAFVSL